MADNNNSNLFSVPEVNEIKRLAVGFVPWKSTSTDSFHFSSLGNIIKSPLNDNFNIISIATPSGNGVAKTVPLSVIYEVNIKCVDTKIVYTPTNVPLYFNSKFSESYHVVTIPPQIYILGVFPSTTTVTISSANFKMMVGA